MHHPYLGPRWNAACWPIGMACCRNVFWFCVDVAHFQWIINSVVLSCLILDDGMCFSLPCWWNRLGRVLSVSAAIFICDVSLDCLYGLVIVGELRSWLAASFLSGLVYFLSCGLFGLFGCRSFKPHLNIFEVRLQMKRGKPFSSLSFQFEWSSVDRYLLDWRWLVPSWDNMVGNWSIWSYHDLQ